MKRIWDSEFLKASIKLLMASFLAAFIGAAWVGYIAIQLGAGGFVWMSLSAVGAAVLCFIIQLLPRPVAGHHLFS